MTTNEDDCDDECDYSNWRLRVRVLERMNGVVMQVLELMRTGSYYYTYRCFYFYIDVQGKEYEDYNDGNGTSD